MTEGHQAGAGPRQNDEDTTRRNVRTQALDAPLATRLIAVSGSCTGCKYIIEDTLTIGRAGDCDIVLDNAECSRHHTRVRRVGAGYTVEDLGSRNGTIVNGSPIEGARAISFGDRIRVGPHDVFLVSPHDPVEEQILHRQRLETLGRLTAGVAHDLNNMLGAVKASVAVIRRLPPEARSGEEAEGCLDDITVAATRAADLAGRLLSFSRPSGSHMPANVSHIVSEGVMLARRTFERTITVAAEIEPSIYVEGDATQLHQVLMNLLVNARDAVEGRGEIRVCLASTAAPNPDPNTVRLTVADSGCGIDKSACAHIFEPFYTTKRPGAGFGLGLATVADIVAAHQGSIDVSSTIGVGTEFTITWPTASQPEPTDHATLDDVGLLDRSGAGLRVALVDDEPVMRRSLARVMRRAGFKVLTFERGEELLPIFDNPHNTAPQAVVLDLDLPGITGEETLRRMRALGVAVPVVCISGHHNPSRQLEVSASGASAFLGKPFEPSTLVAAIFRAIDNDNDNDTTRP